MTSNQSILELNDDCLIAIFNFLSIYELIEAESVCEAFKVICENIYGSKRFHKMRIELRYLRPEHFDNIIKRVGKTWRNFEFSGGYIMDEKLKNLLIEGVSKSCPKMTSLTINYVQFCQESLTRVSECFINLTYLDLSRCNINESTLGFTLKDEQCKNIKTLKLAGNSCMTGKFFKSLKHVEVLDVSHCFILSYFEFVSFLKNCLKLTSLDLTGTSQLIPEDENFLDLIYSHQPHIEQLTMDNTGLDEDKEVLRKFKNLKHSSFLGRKFGL